MIADSQCHVGPSWYEPVEVLLHQMDRNHVDQAVLVQMIGQIHNAYQQDCIERYPGRFASVIWIDPEQPDWAASLRQLADGGASGMRLRPAARVPGGDPFAIWREAQRLDLAVSCVGASADFGTAEFFELVAAFPALPIVLEHLGGTSQPDNDATAYAARLRVFELADFPNVYLKVPGLGELSARAIPPVAEGNPFLEATPNVLLEAVTRFGAARLMWGSDFPPVGSREGYAGALQYCKAALGHLSEIDHNLIFGGVASRVFRLPPNPTHR